MSKVTVGVLRNNLWSFCLDTNTNLLFPDIHTIDKNQLKHHIKTNTFPESSKIQLGDLMLKKQNDTWIAAFPGISLTFNNWIVSNNSNQRNTLLLLSSDADIRDLLEFVLHMFFGQK
jgi:hypothetical protein